MMVIAAMITIGPAIVWLGGGWFDVKGTLTVGIIVSFVVLLNRLYTTASALAGVQIQIVSALAVFERIFDYLDMPEEGDEKPDAITLDEVRGEVRFDDVSFQYSNGRQALENVSFTASPGQMVALVGPSGAGKTTITQLVLR